MPRFNFSFSSLNPRQLLAYSLSGVFFGTIVTTTLEPPVVPETEPDRAETSVLEIGPVVPVEYSSAWHEFSAYEPGMLDEPEAAEVKKQLFVRRLNRLRQRM